MTSALLERRTSGILLHPTSLPGPYGSGDLGPAAYAFADFLARAGQSWWQMLPVGPPGASDSPYDSPSSMAGSAWLVSLEQLVHDRLLRGEEIAPTGLGKSGRAARKFREQRLRLAAERFARKRTRSIERALESLRDGSGRWFADWVMFSALQRAHRGKHWTEWEPELRDRKPPALRRARRELADEIAFHEFVQAAFDQQWRELRQYCRERGIALFGDAPMFVAHDGADVWANRELFFLDREGRQRVVAGVPPDAFSKTGQLWGNPLYDWRRMQKRNFGWWLERFGSMFERFDAVRLDHFIGFRRYWEVEAGARTAQRGRFVRVPGEALFTRVRAELGSLPFVAEDLGLVTPEVTALRDRFGLPGMRVLQFAFGDGGSDYLPHRFTRNSVVYTGTHDNDTIVGWFRRLAAGSARQRREHRRVLDYVGTNGAEIHWDLMRVAQMSVANVAIFPIQDVLGLGSKARMNVPGTTEGNWRWRLSPEQLSPAIATRLRAMTESYERVPEGGIFAASQERSRRSGRRK